MLSKLRHTLFFRLVTPITLFLLLIAVWLTISVLTESRKTIESFRQKQAISHARTLASGSLDAILTRDYSALENWVYAAIPGEDYAYAFIANSDGLIMAHSNFSHVGKTIDRKVYSDIEILPSTYGGRAVVDIIQPIRLGSSYLGTAHVAYYEGTSLGVLNNETAINLLLVSIASLALVGIVVYIVAKRITSPLHDLTETIAASSAEDIRPIPDSISRQRDEIGKLATTFSVMQEDLKNSYRSLKAEKEKLAQAHDEIDRQKSHLETTLHSIAEAVIATDKQGRIEYLNAAAEPLLGWHQGETRGVHIGDIIRTDPSESPLWDLLSHHCLEEGRTLRRDEQPVITRSGNRLYIELSAAPIRDPQDSINGLIIVAHDVTRELILQQELVYKASHDDLTGLRNRMEFNRQLNELVDRISAEDRQHTLLFMDLDQFKLVNDTCGHAAGDELLRRISQILGQATRKHDILSRLGGDEFTLLLTDCTPDEAMPIAEKIRDAVENFHFIWDNQRFNITTSIGMVPINKTNLNHRNILSMADAACYAAKHAGRNQIYRYDENDELLSQHYGEANWVSRINRALNEDRLELHFQLIQPLNLTDPTCDIEILVRLRDEDGQLIPPNAFIPAAERYNLMPIVDRWILQHTHAWFSTHRQQLERLGAVSINLSGETLNDRSFTDFALALFEGGDIPAANFCFEITETTAIANLMTAQQFIDRMKEIGCRFSLDDFGTGMSSFAYLKNLPVDYLKIDGLFIQNIVNDPVDFAMVRAINDIGHMLGLQTIAEFVENPVILAKLVQIGVDYGQGYHFGRPEPIDLLETGLDLARDNPVYRLPAR